MIGIGVLSYRGDKCWWLCVPIPNWCCKNTPNKLRWFTHRNSHEIQLIPKWYFLAKCNQTIKRQWWHSDWERKKWLQFLNQLIQVQAALNVLCTAMYFIRMWDECACVCSCRQYRNILLLGNKIRDISSTWKIWKVSDCAVSTQKLLSKTKTYRVDLDMMMSSSEKIIFYIFHRNVFVLIFTRIFFSFPWQFLTFKQK